MCGIAGEIDGQLPAAEMAARARAMADTMVHRGPDGGEVWAEDGVAVAHRRLAIIDIGSGNQPMRGPSGAVIVFNGEIYNFVELRRELEAKGRRFLTHSDTEVLLALFEEEGEACVERLVGMFAFAIWQPERRRLFLARDRLGKKPLFFAHAGDKLAFASEIKALSTLDWVDQAARLDPQAVSDFLSFGYVLSPKTFLANVRQLPAGHLAWFEAGTLRERDYWRPERLFGHRQPFDRHAQERFAALFDDAVRIRLRSDVPLGAFLSGGLDSSAVVESMVRQMDRPPLAFTVGFTNNDYDESPVAARVAAHLGAEFLCLTQPAAAESDLSRLIWHCDQPFADTSILPTFELCRAARQKVTVALSGDGADELMAGYPTYMADRLHAHFRRVPEVVRKATADLVHNVLRPRYRKVGWDFKLRQFLRSHHLDAERAHGSWRLYFSQVEKRLLMAAEVAEAAGDYDPLETVLHHYSRVPGADFLDRSLYVDIKTWLVDDILVKVDRMSMANSLEVRSPFLDHRLVEFVAGLEPAAKMNRGVQKAILRRHLAGRIPADILRRPKRGFNAPTGGLALTSLPEAVAGQVFRSSFRLDSAREEVTYKGFALATLARWLEQAPSSHLRLPDGVR